MFSMKSLHRNESGQTALETAIILIAFVVVASVFAFTILSAGSASTEKGEEAIYSGLEGVQSSLQIKGAVIAEGASNAVTTLIFTVSPVAGGDPINLASAAADREVVIGYRDDSQFANNLDWDVEWITSQEAAGSEDDLLEEGELAQITVDLASLTTDLGPNMAFTVEVKPPTGGIMTLNRTTPAAIEAVNELR